MKRAIERALVAAPLTLLSRSRRKQDVLILAYHNVLPEGESPFGDSSLHIGERQFREQLDALRRTHTIVGLSEALTSATHSLRPRAVVTFDDAYQGAVTVGVRALVERGLPATIFVAPGLLNRYTWWDRLASDVAKAVPPEDRRRYLKEFAGDGDQILAEAADRARTPRSEAIRVATETELDAAAAAPGITIGSHTWSHCNLAAVNDRRLRDELERSHRWLHERFVTYLPWLAYPYGLFDARSAAMAEAVGYHAALRVDGGWLRSMGQAERFGLPRMNIPAGLSIEGFRLRVDGLLG
jgi:peptidoglycan/xylan/chitin deacetylase (PgdA/CDA1 family)